MSIFRRNWTATGNDDRNNRLVEEDERKNTFVHSARGLIGEDWLPAKADYDALCNEARDDRWAESVERNLSIFLNNSEFIQKDDAQNRKFYCASRICGIMLFPENEQDYYAAGILSNNINDNRLIEYLDEMGMSLSSVTAGGTESGKAGVVITIMKK